MNTTGLTQEQVKEKRKEFGLNEIEDLHKTSALKILLRQVKKNFVLYLLTLTAIASFTLHEALTGYVIVGVISLVIITGFFQEYKAEKAISALKSMILPLSRVRREGKEKEIPSSELVPGDIVIFRTGERVSADCLILEESNSKFNESILTGESNDIGKTPGTSIESYTDENVIFMGAFVVHGRCVAQVLHTGMNTKFGKIAGMISTAEKKLPLQDKVNTISKYMAVVGITAAILTGIVLFMRTDVMTYESIVHIIIIVIALSVSSFPEGFPVVLTTTLAAGVNRMAKQNAVVNRMSIIETLGETSVICTDKTGTLTKGQMTIRKVFCGNELYSVSGVGYENEGNVTDHTQKKVSDDSVLTDLVDCALICNDTTIEPKPDEKEYTVSGTATEGALLLLGAKLSRYKENYSGERLEEMPFDSQRKMMSVLYKDKKEQTVYAKGAPEVLLSKCTHVQTASGSIVLTAKEKEAILKENSHLTSQAYRTLALAYKKTEKTSYTEDEFIFLGLVGMEDPPREEVTQAIELCLRSGIQVKMITGDNKETAQAIAKQIGITGDTLTGDELDKLSDAELTQIVKQTGIFARVKPEDKLRIVRALKENKEIVTMTGDGVNDAPALKEAHIGVAMGINGTDVSRSVADITLKDDNFATIVTAIKEGRTVFNNIRKFVTYQLACNLSDIYILFIGMAVAPYLGWYVPLITALQILYMNIVTDQMPAITLGFNPSSKDIMAERPRKNAQILTSEFLDLILLNGITMGMIAFCITYMSYNVFAFPPETARTTVLVSMIFMQIANAYNFRSFRYGVFSRNLFVNPYLVGASLLSVSITLIIISTPLRHIFEMSALSFPQWIVTLCAPLAIIVFFDLFKIVNNRTKFFLHHIH